MLATWRISSSISPFDPKTVTQTLTIECAAGAVPVRVLRHASARRLRLVADPVRREFRLTLPPRTTLGAARAFLDDHRGWIAARAQRFPEPMRFAPGSAIPFLGEPHAILSGDPRRRGVVHGSATLTVHGPPVAAQDRLVRWLRLEARRRLAADVAMTATALGRTDVRVVTGDTVSRWGSCSSRGVIRLSWRLILAPEHVRRYVVAHEIAHLRHMNHSPDFWALAQQLYGAPIAEPRDWLKRHGALLMGIGR